MLAVPSVTQAIGFCNQGAFARVPPDVLLAAQERGDALHEAAAGYALGLWVPPVIPAAQGYYDSFRRWFDKFVDRTVGAEKTLHHPTLYYHGTPDWWGVLRGDGDLLTLLDWKTPVFASKSWRLQLTAYRTLVEITGVRITRVASLQPRRDGKVAKFMEYTDSLTSDMAIFMSVLNVWRFFNGD